MESDGYRKCPVQRTLEAVGGKWKLLIIASIKSEEVVRFSVLNHLVTGISQKVLAAQLKELEAEGFIRRTAYPEVPPRVEYSLTDLGKSLYPVLDSIADWAEANYPDKPPA
ncbi:winged helix-turn-helix transcriptional regulator [Aliamphritea hakodatensis]|uniref:winged helix-turn-helix transcriptional regulator n=1 Tax=Aliamphritea hakodatensis TaxID=2895352 RepID=UPI0022FD4EBE|nr:helix-turn-helix domain-containing protein [Aliamphritea hakodatensis]